MTKKRQVYWKNKMPDTLRQLLADSGIVVSQQDADKSSSMFLSHGEEDSNVFLKPVVWEKVRSSPTAFINPDLLEWDLPQLILTRFFAGEGALSPEEGYQNRILKSHTLKITDANLFGYYSDVLASFAVKERVNPVQMRNFFINMLTYLSYLNRSGIAQLPIEVDYGLSQNSLFLQIHCDVKEMYLENLLEATRKPDVKNPYVSLLKEALFKTDLMEIYTLDSSNKLVITGCWVNNPNFIRSEFYSTLLIHQVERFHKKEIKRFSRMIEPDSFIDSELVDINKAKVVENLPHKFSEDDKNKELVNFVLVKRLANHINKKWDSPSGKRPFDMDQYELADLKKDIQTFPDKEAVAGIKSSELEETLKALKNGTQVIEEQVAVVKSKMSKEDYLDGLLNSLSKMSEGEAQAAVDEDSLLAQADFDETQRIEGLTEDLTEESQQVDGTKEDLTGESQRVAGQKEDLTEESQRVAGTKEDLTEESQRVAGQIEDLTEESQRVAGQKEDLTEESQRVAGTKEDLTEELQRISGQNEDQTEESQTISGEREDLGEAIQKVPGKKGEQGKEKKVLKGDKQEPEHVQRIKSATQVFKDEPWEVKKQKVIEKVRGKINDLRQNAKSNEEINEEVKKIVCGELGISEEEGDSFINSLSDDVSDDYVRDGINPFNESIKQRIQIEKMEKQLQVREQQVQKMKGLIGTLRSESDQLRKELDLTKAIQKNIPSDDQNKKEEVAHISGVTEKINKNEVSQVVKDKVSPEASSEKEEPIIVSDSSPKEAPVLEDNGKLEDLDKELTEARAREISSGRENEKLNNEVYKLKKENELLLRKLKEGDDKKVKGEESSHNVKDISKENENLKSQIESLKKRLNFMYENSKSNQEISLGANEVQNLIEDKERYFKEKMAVQDELKDTKAEKRELERIIKQKDLEISQKADLLKNKPVGESEDVVSELEDKVKNLNSELKKQSDELKSAQIKAKSYEQKVKFLNVQLEKYQAQSGAMGSGNGKANSMDAKIVGKLKQAETISAKLKENSDKLQAELAEKKTELHKAKLESKTMALKIKDLERKLAIIAKKSAA